MLPTNLVLSYAKDDLAKSFSASDLVCKCTYTHELIFTLQIAHSNIKTFVIVVVATLEMVGM